VTIELRDSALLEDLYQFTMCQGYFKQGIHEKQATFELFYRTPPYNWPFVVAGGIQDALEYVHQLHFTTSDLEYLKSLKLFSAKFLKYLKDWSFTGTIFAVPDGEVVPPNVPMMSVTAPLGEAQLIETALLNKINFQSLIATKASRICYAAQGHPVVDFGLRRAQGMAGLEATKACMIGGCAGTSNVLAGKLLGIPVKGTQAHAWVQSFDTEEESFRAYAEAFPGSSLFLVDTYDTLRYGVPTAIKVAKEMEEKYGKKFKFLGVRLDSGDLGQLAYETNFLLTEAGYDSDVKIVLSNDLDEYKIEDIIDGLSGYEDFGKGAIDRLVFGVGTQMITGHPQPALGGVYKLVELDGKPKMKLSSSPEKTTTPCRKNAIRFFDHNGKSLEDVLIRQKDMEKMGDVDGEKSCALLVEMMTDGHFHYTHWKLEEMSQWRETRLESMKDDYKFLDCIEEYPVRLDPKLMILKDKMIRRMA